MKLFTYDAVKSQTEEKEKIMNFWTLVSIFPSFRNFAKFETPFSNNSSKTF